MADLEYHVVKAEGIGTDEDRLTEECNRLARLGWELVDTCATTSVGGGHSVWLFFKPHGR